MTQAPVLLRMDKVCYVQTILLFTNEKEVRTPATARMSLVDFVPREEARDKRQRTVEFHMCEMSRKDTWIQTRILAVARSWGAGVGLGSDCNGMKLS